MVHGPRDAVDRALAPINAYVQIPTRVGRPCWLARKLVEQRARYGFVLKTRGGGLGAATFALILEGVFWRRDPLV